MKEGKRMNKYQEIINTEATKYDAIYEISDEIIKKMNAHEPLTEYEKVLFYIQELDSYVCQDGVGAFLSSMYQRNLYPKYFQFTVNALKEIGAIQTYEKFREVYNRYCDMQEYNLERMIGDSDFLEAFDKWYYRYDDDLTELQYQYVLKHLV